MSPPETLTLIGTVIVMGIALATLILVTAARSNHRIYNHLARTDEKFDAYLAEAAKDHRVLQSSMDEFRKELQRLAGRRSRMEGRQATTASAE